MREEVTGVWELALERSPLTPDDLNRIPFTLLSFRIVQPTSLEHKRLVVPTARKAAARNDEIHGQQIADRPRTS